MRIDPHPLLHLPNIIFYTCLKRPADNGRISRNFHKIKCFRKIFCEFFMNALFPFFPRIRTFVRPLFERADARRNPIWPLIQLKAPSATALGRVSDRSAHMEFFSGESDRSYAFKISQNWGRSVKKSFFLL